MGMKPISKGRTSSKRQTLKDKYKIKKKVKEHHRKLRRDAKKNGNHGKLKKDPGVPKLHPFKEQIIDEIRAAKEQADKHEHERLRRLQKMQKAQSAKPNSLEALQCQQQSAAARASAYEQEMQARRGALDTVPGEIKDSSRRAFYKEFKKVVETADVVVQVLDARDPLGSRSKLVEEAVIAAQGQKKLVLVLNKIDLVPREVAEAWLKHLRNEFPTVAFKAAQQDQRRNLQHATQTANLAAAGAQGVGVLMKLLANYCRNANIKTTIRVGIVGYPNVGKSSIINSLKRSKVCSSGATPGLTRASQEIVLDKRIRLIDSPGIVFAKDTDAASLVLRNCVRTELLEDPVKAVGDMLSRCSQTQIMQYYAVPVYQSVPEFLQHVARRLGKLKKGGVPNLEAAARVVLQDFNSGNISYFVVPPQEYKPERKLEAAVVSQWAKEFDVDSLAQEEAATLLPTLQTHQSYGSSAIMLQSGATHDDALAAAEAEQPETVTTVKRRKGRVNGATVATIAEDEDMEEDEVEDEEDGEDEDFNFSTDFAMLPGQAMQDEEDEEDDEKEEDEDDEDAEL